MSPGGLAGGRDRNRARQRLRRRPRAEGLGRLRTEPLDDCLENWRENWRPLGRTGPPGLLRVVQRKARGPSWVGEMQCRDPSLGDSGRTVSDALGETGGGGPAHPLT